MSHIGMRMVSRGHFVTIKIFLGEQGHRGEAASPAPLSSATHDNLDALKLIRVWYTKAAGSGGRSLSLHI